MCEKNCPVCDIEHCSDGALKNGYDEIDCDDDYYDYGNGYCGCCEVHTCDSCPYVVGDDG